MPSGHITQAKTCLCLSVCRLNCRHTRLQKIKQKKNREEEEEEVAESFSIFSSCLTSVLWSLTITRRRCCGRTRQVQRNLGVRVSWPFALCFWACVCVDGCMHTWLNGIYRMKLLFTKGELFCLRRALFTYLI